MSVYAGKCYQVVALGAMHMLVVAWTAIEPQVSSCSNNACFLEADI